MQYVYEHDTETHTNISRVLTLKQPFLTNVDLLQVGMKEEPALGGIWSAERHLLGLDVDLGQLLGQSIEIHIVTGSLLDANIGLVAKLHSRGYNHDYP